MSVTKLTTRTFFQGTVLATALWAFSASALPPEHEVRRLMLATEAAVSEQNWGEAGEYLNRLQALEANKPADYLYYRGRVMYEAGHYNEARSALERYIAASGMEGRHYDSALQLITDVENAQRAATNGAESAATGEPVAVIEPAGDESLQSLRRLYLTNSDASALTIHMNSLLELNGWREGRGAVLAGTPPDIQYKVSVATGEIRIQTAQLTDAGGPRQVSTEVLPIYGVNPSVQWDCEQVTQTCWIYDPRDGSRLFQLGHDRGKTRDAARTLGRLIKTLQNPN
ncbi:MAG: tetratricopeptide repeat protein [Marinobacter sp.]|nr:tetratricopeptide repeat protein [Marinobacter sp.]